MDIRPHVEALNARILSGDILGAFEEYYAEDVVMSENGTEDRVGKDVNRDYEKAFVESLAEFHAGAAETVVVDGLQAATEWFLTYHYRRSTHDLPPGYCRPGMKIRSSKKFSSRLIYNSC